MGCAARSPLLCARGVVPMRARALVALALAWPATTKGQACRGDACPAALPQRVAAKLAARLSDEELAATIMELFARCDRREECALSMEQGAVAAASNDHPLDGVDEERAAAAEVKGLDTWLPGTGFRLLFGTPFFSTTLDGAERMNEELAALIDREQASAVASQQQRSMSGGSSFRTDDHFLTRPEPSVRAAAPAPAPAPGPAPAPAPSPSPSADTDPHPHPYPRRSSRSTRLRPRRCGRRCRRRRGMRSAP